MRAEAFAFVCNASCILSLSITHSFTYRFLFHIYANAYSYVCAYMCVCVLQASDNNQAIEHTLKHNYTATMCVTRTSIKRGREREQKKKKKITTKLPLELSFPLARRVESHIPSR